MDDELARLIREEKLEAAAQRAEQQGDYPTAVDCLERACKWSEASRCAARGALFSRAFDLCSQANDSVLESELIAALPYDPDKTRLMARSLEGRRHYALAASLFERSGDFLLAASAWESAPSALRAGACYERASDPRNAARALEDGLRREPENGALRAKLGSLLVGHHRDEAGLRVLQGLPLDDPHRAEALPWMVRATTRLGLLEARRLLELEAKGKDIPLGTEPEVTPKSAGPEKLFGRYEILRLVASTPHARVFECRDMVTARRVAIKLLSSNLAAATGRDALFRFEREARALSALSHPHIVPLQEFVAEGPALVLDWMGGGNLAERLRKERFSPARAVEIVRGVLSALGHAHRLGILHRDIKPANVLFDDSGVARLADFGAAHLGDRSTTATAAVVGTFAYMSPEQRLGRPACPESDVYGVGALLLEMLTGTPRDPRKATQALPSEAQRDLRPEHDHIVACMLSESIEQRPRGAEEAIRLLESTTWPETLSIEESSPDSAVPSHRPTARYATASGVLEDLILGRPLDVVPLNEKTVELARRLGALKETTMQQILALRPDRGEMHLEWLPDGIADSPRTFLDSHERSLEAFHSDELPLLSLRRRRDGSVCLYVADLLRSKS